MKYVCWALIGLGVAAFVVGGYLSFRDSMYIMRPEGYWRGAMWFPLVAISLRLMEKKN